MNNDHGLKNVVLKNINRAISAAWIKTPAELDQTIDSLKSQLEDSRESLKLRITKLSSCNHVFKPTTYTVQQRVLGFVTVYERQCKDCQYNEVFQCSDDTEVSMPVWTKNAHQQYYNNSI